MNMENHNKDIEKDTEDITTEEITPEIELVLDDGLTEEIEEIIDEEINDEITGEGEVSEPDAVEVINDSEDLTEELQNDNEFETEPEVKNTNTSGKPAGYDYRYATPEKKPKKERAKGLNIGSSAAVIALCLVISLLGSFVGGYFGMQSAIEKNGGTVIYQAVERMDKDGNPINTELTVTDAAELVKASVVEIRTETVQQSFFQYVTEGAGSGVIISEDGYIVTNNHVIDGASTIKVRTVDGTEYIAKLIGTDSKTDLAVIKVDTQGLKAAVFGASSSLKVGNNVIAVGNPLGELGGTVTDGIVSALGRELTIDNQTMTLLQTNAAINPGNSGGGLFNLYGELIGIVNAKSSGSGIEGLGFAIPIDDAKVVISQLIDVGYVTGRAHMGVTLLDITDYFTAASYRVDKYGVYILEVQKNSAAEKAGLKPGDYIVAVGEKEVKSSSEVVESVGTMSVGETFTMHIERNGEAMSVPVTLQEYIPTSNVN